MIPYKITNKKVSSVLPFRIPFYSEFVTFFKYKIQFQNDIFYVWWQKYFHRKIRYLEDEIILSNRTFIFILGPYRWLFSFVRRPRKTVKRLVQQVNSMLSLKTICWSNLNKVLRILLNLVVHHILWFFTVVDGDMHIGVTRFMIDTIIVYDILFH